MARLTDAIARTNEYVSFIKDLQEFHNKKGTKLQAEPILGRKKLDLLKIYQVVLAAGGFDEVTHKRGWKQVGDVFQFPSTCTNSAYILKGLYIRNLLGWEEEIVWGREWIPPQELFGPAAHKPWTLAGSTYKKKRLREADPTVDSGNVPANEQRKHQKTVESDVNIVRKDNEDRDISTVNAESLRLPLQRIEVSTENHSQDNKFDTNTKQKILFALQFGTEKRIEWALDYVLTLSFDLTDHLRF